jgi:hypothetical protein
MYFLLSVSTKRTPFPERFLDLNGYTQGPKLKFFDYKTNSAIYELSEGTKPQNYNDILQANADLGELNNLSFLFNFSLSIAMI